MGAAAMILGVVFANMEGQFKIGPQGLEGSLIANTASAVIHEASSRGLLDAQTAEALGDAVRAAADEDADEHSAETIATDAINHMLERAAPGGPMDTLFAWLDAAWTHKSIRAAWPLTDDELRSVMAEAWIRANKEHPDVMKYDAEELREGLAAPYPSHSLFDAFETSTLEEFRDSWGDDFDVSKYGVSSAYRPVPPDYELFFLTPTDGEVWVVERPTLVMTRPFLLRLGPDGWRVASLGPTPPRLAE